MARTRLPQTVWEHLEDLRWHLLAGGLLYVAMAAMAFGFSAPLITLLLRPLNGRDVLFLTPLAPLLFQMRVAFLLAFVASIAPWAGLLLHYCAPALPVRGRSASIALVILAGVLAAAAFAGTYSVLFPVSLAALLAASIPGTTVAITADSYLELFMLETIVAVAIAELPILLVLLSYAGVLNPRYLLGRRRVVYLVLLSGLAVLTPTTDVVTLLACFAPAVAALEFGMFLATLVHTRRAVSRNGVI